MAAAMLMENKIMGLNPWENYILHGGLNVNVVERFSRSVSVEVVENHMLWGVKMMME